MKPIAIAVIMAADNHCSRAARSATSSPQFRLQPDVRSGNHCRVVDRRTKLASELGIQPAPGAGNHYGGRS